MVKHPLLEVFGFPVDDFSDRARRYRDKHLCPFNNSVPNCTKDRANDPLGVCSIRDAAGLPAITCPIRFRQDWIIADDAARFFFPQSTAWTSLTEVRIIDQHGQSAGNIDVVLVSYDEMGRITDFGGLEIQAVYISGNVRRPFIRYMENPAENHQMSWQSERNYPRPDYLSSSRKRLVPQMLYKGTILKSWGKKQAVALHRGFFDTLPQLPRVDPEDADVAWFVYDLQVNEGHPFQLQLSEVIYTQFKPALDRIIVPEVGPIEMFIEQLQSKLDRKLDDDENPPDAPLLTDIFSG